MAVRGRGAKVRVVVVRGGGVVGAVELGARGSVVEREARRTASIRMADRLGGGQW